MNRFFRKFILHKYSDQISAIGKRPVFIISNDVKIASDISSELNNHPEIQIAENNAPFLNHVGSLAYAQFVGPDADYCHKSSKFKGDKLEELLRKISFKNTFGNDYGFELNPFRKSGAKKLKGNMDIFRWGAIIYPDSKTYSGLNFLFENMKAIYFFQDKGNNNRFAYLFKCNNCLCIDTSKFEKDNTTTYQEIYNFLGFE